MSALTLVDSHVHFWDPARLDYPWLESVPALNRPFLPGEFDAATAPFQTAKFLFVECDCEPSLALAEVDWITCLAKAEPRLCGIVAHASLERGEAVRADLEALSRRPLVKGVRRLLQGEKDPEFCLLPGFVAGMKLLAGFGFPFDVCARHDQLTAVAELVRRVPEVHFILDHFGKPPVAKRQIEPWAGDLKRLAALPNTSCKISGLATEADWKDWKPADLEPYFNVVFETFGFDRVIFGGDWPVMTLATDYQRWVETVLQFTARRTDSERHRLFQTNAEKTYRI